MHLIPRYKGDVTNPKGGVRGVIPSKQSYSTDEKPRFEKTPAPKAADAEKRFQRWEKEDDVELWSLFLQGKSIAELADRFGRTALAISYRLKKLGEEHSFESEAIKMQYELIFNDEK